MVRQLVALTLVAVLAFASDKPNPVQPLQYHGDTFCTAFSIAEKAGYFATAAHCAAYALDKEVTIGGEPAWVVFVGFPSADVAVFQVDLHAPAFKLAKVAPEVGDAIEVIGYPYGITRTVTFGTMAARRIPLKHPSTDYYMTSDILAITSAPGNSGSPVLNAKGELIGVLWGGFSDSPHALGVSYEGTMQALAAFAGR